jgi:hypothetical protein
MRTLIRKGSMPAHQLYPAIADLLALEGEITRLLVILVIGLPAFAFTLGADGVVFVEFGGEVELGCEMRVPGAEEFLSAFYAFADEQQDIRHLVGPGRKTAVAVDEDVG